MCSSETFIQTNIIIMHLYFGFAMRQDKTVYKQVYLVSQLIMVHFYTSFVEVAYLQKAVGIEMYLIIWPNY